MMKKRITGILIVSCMLALFGCGSKGQPEETVIHIEKDGEITNIIVEEFDESYYDEEDLKEYTLNAVAEYNAVHGEKCIEVTNLEREKNSDTVSLSMKYKTAGDYEEFNGKTFFAGTVEEAYEAGYDLNITLQDTADAEKTITRSELLEMGGKKVLIAEEAVSYSLPSKALYISSNGELMKKAEVRKADATDGNFLYIIY